MKTKVFFILILTMALLFAGCQQDNMDATVPSATEQTQPSAPKAGLLLRHMTEDEADAQQLRQALEKLGYDVQVKDGENDQSKQNEQVKARLDADCQFMVVQPVMTDGLDVLVEQVKAANVPLVILDHEPEQAVLELYDKLTFLGADHSQAAAALASVFQKLPVNGDLNFDGVTSLVLVCGPEDHIDGQQRLEGFTASIPADTYAVLETVAGDWTREGGRTAAAQMLAKYGPDIEIIVAFDGQMALGVLEAIENGGRVPGRDLYLVTVGQSSPARDAAQQGAISGLACPDYDARLQKLSQLVSALAEGQTVEKKTLVDYTEVLTILT